MYQFSENRHIPLDGSCHVSFVDIRIVGRVLESVIMMGFILNSFVRLVVAAVSEKTRASWSVMLPRLRRTPVFGSVIDIISVDIEIVILHIVYPLLLPLPALVKLLRGNNHG